MKNKNVLFEVQQIGRLSYMQHIYLISIWGSKAQQSLIPLPYKYITLL